MNALDIRLFPRIRLRTIFLLVACVAAGLAVDPTPSGAIEPIIIAIMAVGLAQQIRTLVKWQPTQAPAARELEFARLFAISWRAAVAILFAGYLLYAMLLRQRFLTFPERGELIFIEPLHDGLVSVCMLVVLCNSLIRWRANPEHSSKHSYYAPLLGVAGILIVLLVTLDGTLIQFLVHRAVADVEASQPPQLLREGVYIRPSADAYLPLWFGLGATLALIAAAVIAVNASRRTLSSKQHALLLLAFAAVMIIPTTYSWWYYTHEFSRLSPDMAGAGLALTRFDFACGVGVALVLVAAGAYRLAAIPSTTAVIRANIADDIGRMALHESLPTLFIFAVIGILFVGSLLYSLFFDPPWPSTPSSTFASLTAFGSPLVLLPLAMTVAGMQLCWVRWRKRKQVVPDTLVGLSPRRLLESSAMIAWILAAGVPALQALAFTVWLGPYDLLPLWGL